MVDIIKTDAFRFLDTRKDGAFDTVIACLWPRPTEADLERLSAEALRVARQNVIIETVSHREMSVLRYLNRRHGQDQILWAKTKVGNPLNASRKPMDSHEEILVLRKKHSFYRPFFVYTKPYSDEARDRHEGRLILGGQVTTVGKRQAANTNGRRFPRTVWFGPGDSTTRRSFNLPDNPQPLWLLEQLLFCYTPPLGRVLEVGVGSGTGAVAAKRLGFDYIGIDNDTAMVESALMRLADVKEVIPQNWQDHYMTKQATANRKVMRDLLERDRETD